MKKLLPFIFLGLVVGTFFYKSVFFGKIPMPGDFVLGVYHPWLDYIWGNFVAGVPVKNPLLADVPSLFYPLKIYSTHFLKSGHLPLWNPLLFNGYPLLATFQSSVLNPFNAFFVFFKDTLAWTMFIAFQPLLSAIFMYLLLRELKLSQSAGILGAIAYAFSGFSLIWLEYGIHGYVMAYVPLLLFLASKFIDSPRPAIWGALASAAVALQIFSGYPQITLYTLILIPIWTVFKNFKKTLFLGAFLGLGLALSSIQLLPGLELFQNSQRIQEQVGGGLGVAFLPWSQTLSLLAPDYFGNPTTGNFWGPGDYTNNSGYVGAVVLFLAILGMGRKTKFWTFLFTVTFFLAFPTPISRLISHLPLFSAATATRILVLTALSASVLAAYGLESRFSRRRFWVLFIPLLASLLAFLISKRMLTSSPLASMLTPHIANMSTTIRNLVLPIFFLLAAAAAKQIKLPIASWGLIILTTLELFRFGWKYNPFFDSKLIFPFTPVLEFLKANSPNYRINGGDVISPNLWTAYGLSSSNGYDAVYPRLWASYLSALDWGDFTKPKNRFGTIANYASPLFDLTSTRYITALKRNKLAVADPAGKPSYYFDIPKLKPVYSDRSVVVLENTQAIPKYSLVSSTQKTNSDAETIANLSTKTATSSDPEFPVLEKNSGGKVSEMISPYPENIILKTSSDVAAVLLNTQVFYPGWKATIDGKTTKIFRTNYAFQSVLVPAGDHRVEFTYSPDSYRIGKYISGATALLLFIICLLNQLPSFTKMSLRTGMNRRSKRT